MSDPRIDRDSEFYRDPGFRTFERMSAGQWYIADGEEFDRAHAYTRPRIAELNRLNNMDGQRHQALLAELLSEGSAVPDMWAPLYLEYGCNVTFGEGCYVNVGATIVDVAPVTVGARTMIGPNVELITATHPVNDLEMRRAGWERGLPIVIGEDCWLGSRVSVMPGVTIGDRCVIAAGAVVTSDVPDDSLMGGVPARLLRRLNTPDSPLERDELDA
ncbi:sugar O-acetyltransferase [Corynebacterium uterequi]|nr:sugar O-acetyltransferase [Corynebacterium uterequi]